MQTAGPLVAGLMLSFGVLIVFAGVWWRGRAVDPVEARLAKYGGSAGATEATGPTRSSRGLLVRSGGGAISARVADKLSKADLPLTVAEFLMLAILGAGLAFAVGYWRGGAALGILIAAVVGVLPLILVNSRANKRREAFVNQIPDVLSLMIGALKAGYGVTQAIAMLVERLSKPSSVEFGRAMRAIGLGLPVTRALNDMAARVESDDLYLVVTAMNVQQELGGNLAQILEIIAETVRERIRIKREIQVMTAQQRITGVVLSLLPIAAVLIIGTLNREYMSRLFTTMIGRMMIGAALFLELIGWLVIRKIVAIEV